MDPASATIAVTALAAQIGSTIFGGKAQKAAAKQQMRALKEQAKASRDQSLYQSRIARMNADITLSNISNLNKAEKNSLIQVKDKLTKTVEAQSLSFASSGFSQSSGTLSFLKEDTMKKNSLDVQVIRDSFTTGRWNIRAKAQQFEAEAERLFDQAVRLDPMNNQYGVNSSLFNANMVSGISNTVMQGVNFFQ